MMYKNNLVAVIKANGQILRERGGNSVYLPFGAEYSILIKNKDARRALVNIEVDGKKVFTSGRKLILDGNAQTEIKGWMRSMRKTNRFKFIQKTKQIQKHRGDRIDDGLVRVTYQFEKHYDEPVITWTSDWRSFVPDSDWNDSIRYGSSTGSPNFNDSSTTISCYNVSHASSSDFSVNQNIKSKTKSFAPNLDEGITVKGEHITNQYRYGTIGALESRKHTIVLQLKGQTARKKRIVRPLTVKASLKCDVCGRSAKSSSKYCSRCGNYLF
jgi:hypothetical protein